MYNIHYDICAIMVIFVEIIMYYSRKRIHVGQNKIYIYMVFLLLLSTSSSLIAGVSANSGGIYSKEVSIVANNIYFVTHTSLPMLFALYNIFMTVKISRYKAWKRVLFLVPYAIVLVSLVVNAFTGFVFTVDDNGKYTRGLGLIILYAVALLYFIYTVIYVTSNRKYIEVYRLIYVYAFAGFILIPIGLQTIYPNLLVEGFGEAICFLLIYASLEQRVELIDGILGMYNKKAFVNFVNININTEEKFSTMSISLNDVNYLEKNFGIEFMTALELEIAKRLKEVSSGYEAYYIGDYIFFIVDNNMSASKKSLDDIANELSFICGNNWTVGDVEIPVSMDICIMRCPDDVNSLEQIFDCREYISNEERSRGSRIIYANQVNSFYGKRKSQIKKAIQKAIKNQSFKVYYQPIFSNKEGRINSAEALVRLFDDELGYISPEEFIPIAEEDGSILKIGGFVLESVCKLMKENDIRSKGIEYIEVNVSVIECMKHNMASKVAGLINRYGLEPSQINLEITETAAMNSPEVVGINMFHLVDYGVNFSLDDYGSGYSNINYLVGLPFNLIKVDKNIVWASFANDKAGIALASSIAMIRRLDYKIVAEGIETKEQADKLTEMGCDFLQGFYFSKPLPEKEFLEYIS